MPIPSPAPSRGRATLLALGALLLAALGSPPHASAERAGRLTAPCLECHAGQDSSLARSAHRVSSEGPAAAMACTDCHPGDSRHWEEDAAANPMTEPSRLGAAAEARLCGACHANAHQHATRGKDVHLSAEVACSACHVIHRAAHEPLLKAAQTDLCLGCHTSVAGQFARPFRHPVGERVMTCGDCHTAMGATAGRLERSPDEICVRCHAEMAGPFPHEHPATLGFSTEEGGCMVCHDPHGSALPRMLKQPYQGPTFPLCRQCHLLPGHLSNPMHGTRWAGVPCNECHSDIHGSYTSRLLLNESLRSQGCFNVGCHHD